MRSLVVLLVILGLGCSRGGSGPMPSSPSEKIAQQVEQERQSSAAAVDAYIPKVKGHIDDLAAPAADILRQLPGVAEVEVLVRAPKPTHRIIHLRDWHYVPRELFALDARQQAGRPLSDEDVDKLHRKQLLGIELVQLEQTTILRCLVKHHGLKRVLSEGLTPRGLSNYKDIVAALRDMDNDIAGLRKARPGERGSSGHLIAVRLVPQDHKMYPPRVRSRECL